MPLLGVESIREWYAPSGIGVREKTEGSPLRELIGAASPNVMKGAGSARN